MKRLPITELIILAVFIFIPFVLKDNYFLHLLILFLIWVVIGSSWNIFAGYTGQVSFGHAAFFGAGAYTAGLLAHHFGYSAWWGMALGGPVAVLISLPFGLICFPLRGAYFALASLALNLILMHLATIAEDFTGGMQGVMIMSSFVSKIPYYYIALAMAVTILVVVNIIVRSKLGYYFVSIREDQDAAESLGVNSTLYKNISLSISVFFTGTAGALYMNYMGFIDPSVVFSLNDYSIMAILVAIVGGVGTVYGPMVGAFIMVAVNEFFRSGFFGLLGFIGKSTGSASVSNVLSVVTHAHVLVFGILVVVVILFLPNGVVGDWEKIKRKVFRIKPAA
ncbi:MAG: branched-chain amino acid ABC transporter permease [Planctomycetes bacterium]|nr:branched-chain amino acid ABC transporter permease [Planctomycetota bacterium]